MAHLVQFRLKLRLLFISSIGFFSSSQARCEGIPITVLAQGQECLALLDETNNEFFRKTQFFALREFPHLLNSCPVNCLFGSVKKDQAVFHLFAINQGTDRSALYDTLLIKSENNTNFDEDAVPPTKPGQEIMGPYKALNTKFGVLMLKYNYKDGTIVSGKFSWNDEYFQSNASTEEKKSAIENFKKTFQK